MLQHVSEATARRVSQSEATARRVSQVKLQHVVSLK